MSTFAIQKGNSQINNKSDGGDDNNSPQKTMRKNITRAIKKGDFLKHENGRIYQAVKFDDFVYLVDVDRIANGLAALQLSDFWKVSGQYLREHFTIIEQEPAEKRCAVRYWFNMFPGKPVGGWCEVKNLTREGVAILLRNLTNDALKGYTVKHVTITNH